MLDDTIMNVCSGDYTVMLTDSNDCLSSSAGNTQVIVGSIHSTTPLINVINNVDCYGEATGELEVSNPDPNYIYNWIDMNGLNVGTGITAPDLYAGDYNVIAQFATNSGGPLPSYNIGPVDTSFGLGGYSNSSRALLLNCSTPSKLVSALVYAEIIKKDLINYIILHYR